MINRYYLWQEDSLKDPDGPWVKWDDVEQLLDKIIDSVADRWHDNNVYGSLREWLGLTKEEYEIYVLKTRKE